MGSGDPPKCLESLEEPLGGEEAYPWIGKFWVEGGVWPATPWNRWGLRDAGRTRKPDKHLLTCPGSETQHPGLSTF